MLRTMKTLARLSMAGLSASLLATTPASGQTFADEVAFMQKHTKVLVLTDGQGMRVAVAPDLQGRAMTSSARGDAGPGYGWINRGLLSSATRDVHFNPYGGEDRFWLGGGGQYSVFFKAGEPFDLALVHTGRRGHRAYPVRRPEAASPSTRRSPDQPGGHRLRSRLASCASSRASAEGPRLDGTEAVHQAVAFESRIGSPTRVRAREGSASCRRVLGMFKPSPQTTVVVPSTRGRKRPWVRS